MKNKANLIVPDTNVLIGDQNSVKKLINGENLVVIPLTVLCELDNLKNDSRIGSEVRRTIKEIEELIFASNRQLIIEKNMLFSNLHIEQGKADSQIIATFNYVLNNKSYQGYQKYKLVTDDINMRLIAHSLFSNFKYVSVERYQANLVNPQKIQDLPMVLANDQNISLDYSPKIFGEVIENGGVLIASGKNNNDKVLAIRKGNKLEIIPADLEIFGLKAHHNNQVNWEQLLAMRQLLDKGIYCIFIQGPAGTGKTLLAIAAALEQKNDFEQLILVSPMVPLSNQQKLGFLPGDIKEKTTPWLAPFSQNIRFLEHKQTERMLAALGEKDGRKLKRGKNEEQELIEKKGLESLWEKYGFVCQPLEYIRGQTIINAFIIIEEAQNLSQHEIKTIITRAGEGSKLVFCGDLSQIDLPYISVKNSGLTYAIEKISGTSYKNKMVGVSVLKKTVRSKLSAFASEVM